MKLMSWSQNSFQKDLNIIRRKNPTKSPIYRGMNFLICLNLTFSQYSGREYLIWLKTFSTFGFARFEYLTPPSTRHGMFWYITTIYTRDANNISTLLRWGLFFKFNLPCEKLFVIWFLMTSGKLTASRACKFIKSFQKLSLTLIPIIHIGAWYSLQYTGFWLEYL